MDSEVRTDVWNDMIHTDGLARYYWQLWQQVDHLPTDEVREQWKRLSGRMNEITSLMSSGRMNEKLRDSTEKQADEYWEAQKQNQIARQNDPRYALPAI